MDEVGGKWETGEFDDTKGLPPLLSARARLFIRRRLGGPVDNINIVCPCSPGVGGCACVCVEGVGGHAGYVFVQDLPFFFG